MEPLAFRYCSVPTLLLRYSLPGAKFLETTYFSVKPGGNGNFDLISNAPYAQEQPVELQYNRNYKGAHVRLAPNTDKARWMLENAADFNTDMALAPLTDTGIQQQIRICGGGAPGQSLFFAGQDNVTMEAATARSCLDFAAAGPLFACMAVTVPVTAVATGGKRFVGWDDRVVVDVKENALEQEHQKQKEIAEKRIHEAGPLCLAQHDAGLTQSPHNAYSTSCALVCREKSCKGQTNG